MPSRSEPISSGGVFPICRRLLDFLELTKPKINVLVGVVLFAGFYLAVPSGFDVRLFLHALFGTLLLGSGASALNQVLERERDSHMKRTENRPVTAGRIGVVEGGTFGAGLVLCGFAYLFHFTNPFAAVVGGCSALLYVLVYTPLKSRTVFNTLIGAVPGALPPLIGWTAAGGALDLQAWSLFSILFLWQLPHFMAISWMHREDYARAGILNLAVLDPEGKLCSQQAVLHSMILLPVSLVPSLVGLAGTFYLLAAFALGSVFTYLCFRFAKIPTKESARQLFYYSLFYLPVLYLFMMVDRV